MPKIVFSSEELPKHLDDEARFRLWRDIFASRYGPCEASRVEDASFSGVFEFVPFGSVAVTRQSLMARCWARTARDVAASPRADFLIGFNLSGSPPAFSQHGRELVLGAKGVALLNHAEPVEVRAAGGMAQVGISVPQARLLERVPDAEDLALSRIDASMPAAGYLRRYLEFLLDPNAALDDPALTAHIEATLLDLVALALGAQRDSAEIARMGGLRAARLREILAAISAGFADPAFSAGGAALKLGLSPRYMQELLQETGASFTERVMELRLQKARAMLADPQHDRRKVSDIGFACGFNEVSYFNRCFRRRFGASPTQFRGGNGVAS